MQVINFIIENTAMKQPNKVAYTKWWLKIFFFAVFFSYKLT